jgi:hypothetical protein
LPVTIDAASALYRFFSEGSSVGGRSSRARVSRSDFAYPGYYPPHGDR